MVDTAEIRESVPDQRRLRELAEGNLKIEQLKHARRLLVEAKEIMTRIDGPIASEIHLVTRKLDDGLARVLLARELNS